jgi:hypothetical protein
LRGVWPTIERHAPAIDALCEQLAKVTFEVLPAERALLVRFGLANPGDAVRVLLRDGDARFFLDQAGTLVAIDPEETQLDRALFLILAELARPATESPPEEQAAGLVSAG